LVAERLRTGVGALSNGFHGKILVSDAHRTGAMSPPIASSLLLFRILEGRCSDQVAGVGAPKARDTAFTKNGVHGAVGSFRLVCKAAEVFLDKTFLEAFARVTGNNFIAHVRRKLLESFSKYIEANARIE